MVSQLANDNVDDEIKPTHRDYYQVTKVPDSSQDLVLLKIT